MNTASFRMPRPSRAGVWIFSPAIALLLAIAVAFIIFVVGPKRLVVEDGKVALSGAIYGHELALADIDPAGVRAVDLRADAALDPRKRTNGLDLFGYLEGWFELANGVRAMVVLSSSEHAVYLPTRSGVALLFSPSDVAGVLRRFGSPAPE